MSGYWPPASIGLDPADYSSELSVPEFDEALGRFVPGTGSGPNETVSAPSFSVDTTGGTFDVTVTAVWGIDASGEPYYNASGVTAGQEAVLVHDNDTGEFALRPIEV